MASSSRVSIAMLVLIALAYAAGHLFAAPGLTPQPVRVFKHPNVSVLAISPDGRLLASGSSDEYIGPGEVKVWDVSSGKLRKFLFHEYEVDDLAFSPDSKTLAIASGGDVRLWDVRTWKLKRRLRSGEDWQFTCSVAFSPDGKTIAGGSGMGENGEVDRAYLWNAQTGRLKRTLAHSEGATTVVFSPNVQILAGAVSSGYNNDASGMVKLWKVRTGLLQSVHPHPWVNCLAMSPDGKTLATGSSQEVKDGRARGEIRLWDVPTGKLVRTLRHGAGIVSLAFSPDGLLRASSDTDGTIRLSDAATGLIKREWKKIGAGAIVFSPNDRFLICASETGSVQMWAVL